MNEKKKPQRGTHKLGANRNEIATKPHRLKPGFSQSRDVREDRGTRQTKIGRRKQPLF